MSPPETNRVAHAAPVRRQTVSLRRLITVGGVGLGVVLLVPFGFFHHASGAVADRRAEVTSYFSRLEAVVHRHGEAVLAADATVREAHARGRHLSLPTVASPIAELDAALRPDERTALAPSLSALTQADRAWRAAMLAAVLSPSAPSTLDTLQGTDLAVTRAIDQVEDEITARERSAVAALSAEAAHHVQMGLASLVIAGLLGVLFLLIVVRQTVYPLTALARHAQEDAGVPDDVGVRVTELRDLGDALHRLKVQAHDRQVSLEQSRRSAFSLSRFAELVQGTGRPLEIRAAVATMLEGALPQGDVQVVEWNDGRTRMQRTWPELHDRPTEVAFDPETCPAIRRKRPVRADVTSDASCDCAFGAPAEGSYACIPMLSAGQVNGLINIRSRKVGAWTRGDVVGAQAYVNFASSALGTIQVLESTRDRALRDGLTGAYNRRFLDEYLLKRLADSLRHKQPLSVLLLDLDHFKQLNDTFGHATGDQALVEFARMVESQIRTGDAFVRYGGEEFVLVLTGTDLEGAMIVAERVRARAERIALTVAADGQGAGQTPRVSASIGVATVGEHGGTAPEILAAADRAVYRAKARGRNRVEIAEPVAEPAQVASAVESYPLSAPSNN